MKSYKTVVQDIYKLLESNTPIATELVDKLGQRLTELLKARLCAAPTARSLSMSALGSRCLRQLWYKENKPELAEPLPGHARLNYLVGDLVGELLPTLIEASGHEVTGEQDTLSLHGVEGHRDLVIDGHLVDVKTSNARGFSKFQDNEVDDTFGYRTQLDVYLEASKEDEKVKDKGEASFLAFDKERGRLVLDTYPKRNKDWKEHIDHIKTLLSLRDPPPRAFTDVSDGRSGNRCLPLECSYCAFKEDCWKDSNDGQGLRKFFYSNGPRWLTKVMRTPEVDEEK